MYQTALYITAIDSKIVVPYRCPTISETEVAMSSMMMSSSVLAGCMMAAKYSVILGELHFANTDTSCRRNTHQAWIDARCNRLTVMHKALSADLVYVLNIILTAQQHNNMKAISTEVQKGTLKHAYTSSRSMTLMATSRCKTLSQLHKVTVLS